MNLFEVQTNLKSYSYPIVKIIACITLILLCIFRGNIFDFSSRWIDMIVSLVCFVVVVLCILCLYISIGEIFHTYSNRHHTHVNSHNAVVYSQKAIVNLVKEQDIVEVDIITSVGIIKVGSSSENDYCSSCFFDKKYYIGNKEFKTSKQFAEALTQYTAQNKLLVVSIDGLPPQGNL